jgi:polygalacturonase
MRFSQLATLAAAVFAYPDAVSDILARIHEPTFRDADFLVADFGCVADGETDCRPAINQAIRNCSEAGGGRVVLPKGVAKSNGPVLFKSNVNLFVDVGSTIRFSHSPADYLPAVLTKFEGTELFNYSPLIYAYQLTNVAITGGGTLDGQGSSGFQLWSKKQSADQDALRRMGNDSTPVYQRVFGEGHYLRPSFVQFFGCRNVFVNGVTIVDSTFWVVHPVYCNNVIVRNITVISSGPNSDGTDPESCVDVLVEDSHYDTSDDCISIKSGRDADAWRVGQPSENVVVRNLHCNTHAHAVCIGTCTHVCHTPHDHTHLPPASHHTSCLCLPSQAVR